MTLSERCKYFSRMFNLIKYAKYLPDKQRFVRNMPTCMWADYDAIMNVLTGRTKIGYTWIVTSQDPEIAWIDRSGIAEIIDWLEQPLQTGDLSEENILEHTNKIRYLSWFFRPIVDGTVDLGCHPSHLLREVCQNVNIL